MTPSSPAEPAWVLDKALIENVLQKRVQAWVSATGGWSDAQHPKASTDLSESVRSTLAAALYDPASSSLMSPGKRMRPLLSLWAARNESSSFELAPERLPGILEIGLATELLHCGSLIVDDVQDGSEKRRGQLAVHSRWGESMAINAGNWLYFEAIAQLNDAPSLQKSPRERASLVEAALAMMRESHLGQTLDLACASERTILPLLERPRSFELAGLYRALALRKTAALMRFGVVESLKWMSASETSCNRAGELIELYGLIYQQADDLRNLCPSLSEEKTNEDLQTLRNIVTVNLLKNETVEGLQKARDAASKNRLATWVLDHPLYASTVHSCADNLTAELKRAKELAQSICSTEVSWSYFNAVLHTPLERLADLARDTVKSITNSAPPKRVRELSIS